MHKIRLELLFTKLFHVVVVASLFFPGVQANHTVMTRAQEILSLPIGNTTARTGIQSLATNSGSFYYYADGQRIPLQPSLNWVLVKFASADPAKQSAALRNSGAPLESLSQARLIPNPELTLLPVQQGTTVQTLVQGINSMRAMPDSFLAVDPVFQTTDAEMVITNQFIATFPAEKSLEDINIINSMHSAEIVEPILGQNNTFVLKLLPDAHLDALAMANLYQESGLALNAAPDFVRITRNSPEKGYSDKLSEISPMAGTNDYWYSDQWYLNNTGYLGNPADVDIDAPEAWNHNTGSSSVIIAIMDEGVDLTHEDLSAKLVGGYDATGGGSGGGPSGNDAHGTGAAGIVAAASNNTIGIAGVCQNCSIMPVRIAYDNGMGEWVTSDSWIANGMTWAYQHGAWILNNSWGGGSSVTVVNTAINNAKTQGRGGKGSVVVASAGNENASTISWPASLSTVIAVGASNLCDQRKIPTSNSCNAYENNWGSNYGSALDISAPGVWLDTTDIMGAAGYSSGNYYNYFNGTSGATPVVSGVAGLVLSANPYLTADEVQTILQNTADDVNGGGWDSTMGYGRVNANRAVVAALAAIVRDTTGVFRPSNGALYLKNSNSTGFADVAINYGLPGDYPVVGDWDGDGTATIGIYRNGIFYLRNSNTIGFADIVFAFGAPGDQPIAGDWNGDGIDTIGVYRSSAITFYLRNSNSPGAPEMSFALGNPGDVGLAGDWNGDGMDTTGVFRPSNGALYLKNTNVTGFADIVINYGLPGDKPVTGDWNNDGIDTIGIYRNGTFYLRNNNTIGFADLVFALGINGDMPIAGNWDGLP
jgi:subtilisin family serine protease